MNEEKAFELMLDMALINKYIDEEIDKLIDECDSINDLVEQIEEVDKFDEIYNPY